MFAFDWLSIDRQLRNACVFVYQNNAVESNCYNRLTIQEVHVPCGTIGAYLEPTPTLTQLAKSPPLSSRLYLGEKLLARVDPKWHRHLELPPARDHNGHSAPRATTWQSMWQSPISVKQTTQEQEQQEQQE